jgi:hypothetical protein
MDLNSICIGLLSIPILYAIYLYFTQSKFELPAMPKSLWGEQVGKSKQIQSKTGDASLFIQSSRRNATKNGGFGSNNMNGAIDYCMITRNCPCPIYQPCKCVCCEDTDGGNAPGLFTGSYDGGGAKTEYSNCNIDGGAVIHGQNCGCCPAVDGGDTGYSDYIYDGGNTITNYNGSNLDGGNA